MAKFVQIKVWKVKKPEDLPLIMTFTNMKQATDFEFWLIKNGRKYDKSSQYKLFTTCEQAVEELGFWEY